MTDQLRVTRTIGLALGAGVTAVAAIAAYVHATAEAPAGAGAPLLFLVWVGTAVTLSAVAIMHWRSRVAPLLEARLLGDADRSDRARTVQTGTIITWAMVEAPALFGVVVYLVEGTLLAGIAGVAMMWVAIAMTWPRPGWFE